MAVSRRNQKRVNSRFTIRFGQKEPQHIGFAKNLSLKGMELTSRIVYKPGVALNLSIESGKNVINLQGIVRWTSDADRMVKMSGLNSSMGIELVEEPEKYVDFLLNTVDTFKERRLTPRHGAVIKVIFENEKELIEKYTRDISQGGLFIVSDVLPPFDSVIEVKLIIAMTMTVIRAMARVVYVVSPEMARDQGLNIGFGVQFLHFLEQGDKKLAEYIGTMRYS